MRQAEMWLGTLAGKAQQNKQGSHLYQANGDLVSTLSQGPPRVFLVLSASYPQGCVTAL